MRWLEWSTFDLRHGLGGVEMHARSLARELSRLGIEVAISSDEAELGKSGWDVVHTHGSSGLPRGCRLLPGTFHVHTLHGTALGRMRACREWFWLGGYRAAGRERAAVRHADLVLTVHPDLWLFREALAAGRQAAVCGNGWDAVAAVGSHQHHAAPSELAEGFWLFVGRSRDPVKGADVLVPALERAGVETLVAVPGVGPDALPPSNGVRIVGRGPATPEEIQELMHRAEGLVLSSRYEGLPLVVLEALGMGIPVAATPAGGVRGLSNRIQGLVRSERCDAASLARALEAARALPNSTAARAGRAAVNRAHLLRWEDVARRTLSAVERASQGRLCSPTKASPPARISVLVPTLGRTREPLDTVRALLRQTRPPDEIIVADQNDPALPQLDQAFAAMPTVRHLHVPQKGVAFNYNRALHAATGDIVLFVDDDVEPSPDLVRAHLEAYASNEAGAVGLGGVAGRLEQAKDRDPRKIRDVGRYVYRSGRFHANYNALQRCDVHAGQGCNVSFDRRVLVACRGFDEGFTGNAYHFETEAGLRVHEAGYRIVFEPQASLVHLQATRGGARLPDKSLQTYYYVRNGIRLYRRHSPGWGLPGFIVRQIVLVKAKAFKNIDLRILVRGLWGVRDGLRQDMTVAEAALDDHEGSSG